MVLLFTIVTVNKIIDIMGRHETAPNSLVLLELLMDDILDKVTMEQRIMKSTNKYVDCLFHLLPKDAVQEILYLFNSTKEETLKHFRLSPLTPIGFSYSNSERTQMFHQSNKVCHTLVNICWNINSLDFFYRKNSNRFFAFSVNILWSGVNYTQDAHSMSNFVFSYKKNPTTRDLGAIVVLRSPISFR